MTDAFKSFARKTNLPTTFLSGDFEAVPNWLKEQAFWMSGVNDAETLQLFRDEIERIAKGDSSGSESMIRLRAQLEKSGYQPPPNMAGTIKDLNDLRRMSVSIDTNVAIARGYGSWVAAQKGLRAFPAWELIREAPRKEPRDWDARWESAYKETSGMPGSLLSPRIALVNHPIWQALDGFGNGYPPFDYNSGMGVNSVGFVKSRDLGLTSDPKSKHLWETPTVSSPGERLELQPKIKDQDLRDAVTNRLKGLGKWDGDTLISADPNGTRPMTAAQLAENWKEGMPKGFKPFQRDAMSNWLSSGTPSNDAKLAIDRLTVDEPASDINSQDFMAKKDHDAFISTVGKEYTVPEYQIAMRLTTGKPTSIPGSWSIVMSVTDGSNAIDITPLVKLLSESGGNIDAGSEWVYPSGRRFKIKDIVRTSTRQTRILMEEIND